MTKLELTVETEQSEREDVHSSSNAQIKDGHHLLHALSFWKRLDCTFVEEEEERATGYSNLGSYPLSLERHMAPTPEEIDHIHQSPIRLNKLRVLCVSYVWIF